MGHHTYRRPNAVFQRLADTVTKLQYVQIDWCVMFLCRMRKQTAAGFQVPQRHEDAEVRCSQDTERLRLLRAGSDGTFNENCTPPRLWRR